MTQTEWIICLDDDLKDYDELFVGNVRDGDRLIRCKDCKHWMTEDRTFPDFDGKEWHRCKKLRTFTDEDGDTPMTLEWHYCRMAERKEE